ncbi:GSCFA family protein [Dyadobacter jejuensis]|uniref:GSCFA family protein n=1 Tax=Dyadobacter jejuensis TaxID=1082580 RepID=A0A316ANC0_9BACT|nr:GSCFA domain-containing protein [Dyadobacter jejuensis]PWJ58280.1 GSCFA family protein [Dyadobacter jejuensis]
MKLPATTTEVAIQPANWQMNLHTKVITMGSCFAEVLGQQLSDHKFEVMNNPLATIFNPLTISKILNQAVGGNISLSPLFIENLDGIWLHHDFHSSFWQTRRELLESHIKNKLAQVRAFLREADLLVITLGTAFAYRHKATNQLVGNCHKVPADRFVRELLHPDQISNALEDTIFQLLTYNRNLKILVTVSPVRHTRDTLSLNQVSKSTLRLVCHRLTEKFKHVTYFPGYELMIDELRDYRYYKEDLIHPNRMAEDYIFHVFVRHFVEESTQKFIEEWQSVRHMMDHKPRHGFTESYRKMLLAVDKKLVELCKQVDVTLERIEVARRLEEFSDKT